MKHKVKKYIEISLDTLFADDRDLSPGFKHFKNLMVVPA